MIDQPSLGTYDFLANIVLSVVVITLANVILIIRIVQQKEARNNQAHWPHRRKLALQLLYVAMIFVVFWIPLTVNGLLLTFTSSETALNLQADYFFFFVYMVPILVPFVSLSYLPHFRKRLLARWRRRIGPSVHFI